MKKKVIISDLDGTLLKHKDGLDVPRSILEEDKDGIRRMLDTNIFVISTGRNFISVDALCKSEGIDMSNGYFITSNGAQIYDGVGNVHYERMLEPAILQKTIHLFQGLPNKEHLCFHLFDGSKVIECEGLQFTQYEEQIRASKALNLCVFSNRGEVQDVTQFLALARQALIDASIAQNNWYVDVLSKDISKASAITYLLKQILKKEEIGATMAIGDSWNDISMFSVVDESFTFRSSPSEVQEKAKHIVSHFYEAIAYMEEKYS